MSCRTGRSTTRCLRKSLRFRHSGMRRQAQARNDEGRRLPLEPRLALLLESRDAFLQILAGTDRIEDAARFGDDLERALRHRIPHQLLQRLHHQRRTAGDLGRHLLGLHDMLALRCDLVDKAELVGALDRQLVADQQELHRNLVRQARDQRGNAAGGGADLDLGIAEARGLGGDAEIGHLHQHEAAADYPARRRGDYRLVEIDAKPRHRMPHVDRKILHIGADAEIRLLAGGQHRDAIVAVAKAQPRFAQFIAQGVVQGIVRGRAVHGDGRDVVFAFVTDECHEASPFCVCPHDSGAGTIRHIPRSHGRHSFPPNCLRGRQTPLLPF